jgi:hypothetical protein
VLLRHGHQQGEGNLVRCAMNGRCTLAGDVVEAVYTLGLHHLVEDQVRIGYIASALIEHIRGDDSIAPPAQATAPPMSTAGSTPTAQATATPLPTASREPVATVQATLAATAVALAQAAPTATAAGAALAPAEATPAPAAPDKGTGTPWAWAIALLAMVGAAAGWVVLRKGR